MAQDVNNFSSNPGQYVKKINGKRELDKMLPSNLQTELLTKFFGGVVNHNFQPENSEHFTGFVGKHPHYATDSDIYIQEQTADRKNYQLEPGMVSVSETGTQSALTYDDLLNHIRFNGGDISKPTRLFEQDYYSWAPPVNIDMLVNYTDYYWVPQGPSIIPIISTRLSPIKFDHGGTGTHSFVGQSLSMTPVSFETNGSNIHVVGHDLRHYQIVKFETDGTLPANVADDVEYYVKKIDADNFELGLVQAAVSLNVDTDIIGQKEYTSPNGVQFSSGMHVRFEGLNIAPEAYVEKIFIVEGVGNSIRLVPRENMFLPKEFESEEVDYIVTERGSEDLNPWSLRNNWYHKDQLLLNNDDGTKIQTYGISAWDSDPWDTLPWDFDESQLPEAYTLNTSQQAKRPILCFDHDLELYKSGTKFIDFVDTIDTTTSNIVSQIIGQTNYTVNNVVLQDGMRILVTADDSSIMNNKLYDVRFLSGRIALDPVLYNVDVISKDNVANPEIGDKVFVKLGTKAGTSYFWDGNTWAESQHKTHNNQQPKFELYDNDGIAFSNNFTYSVSDFVGSTIFEFKLNSQSGAPVDPVMSLPLTFKGRGQVSDIVFSNTINDDVITYKSSAGTNVEYNGFKYYRKFNNGTSSFSNAWHPVSDQSRQYYVERFVVEDPTKQEFPLETPVETDLSHHVFATANDAFIRDFSIENNVFKYTNLLEKGTVIQVFVYNNKIDADDKLMTLPTNLASNPLNEDISDVTRADFFRHFGSIIGNQVTLKGNENLSNNYRNTERDMSRGHYILQHSAPLLKTMLLASDENLDIVKSIRFCSDEYNRFRNKLLIKATNYFNSLTTDKTISTRNLFDKLVAEINLAKADNFPFANTQMIASGNDFIEHVSLFAGTHEKIKYESFDMSEGSTASVLVYADDKLLIDGIDYKINDFGQMFIVSLDITDGTTITTRTYQNKNNSFIPSTPAAMGLIKNFVPSEKVDDTFVSNEHVIVGHDGNSYVKSGAKTDDVMFELEKRIYNAINPLFKNRKDFIVDFDDIVSNAYRTTEYSRSEFVKTYGKTLNLWASQNSINLYDNTSYDPAQPKTWNYKNTPVFKGLDDKGKKVFEIDSEAPGHWRGLFEYYYGTQRPHTAPWEMVGFTEKPDWFDAEYGVAPYTAGNDILWNDMEAGIIKLGDHKGTYEKFARPNLSAILPVDAAGQLLMPVEIGLVVDKPLPERIEESWVIGDMAPAENTWWQSVTNPFSMCINYYLMKPAQLVELGWSTLDYSVAKIDNRQRISKLSGNRSLKESAKIHGIDGNIAGVQQFISEFLTNDGKDIKTNFADKINQLDVRLVHRFGSFVKNNNLIVNSESTISPIDRESRIPEEDVELIVYESPSKRELFYSGVIVEKVAGGYKVYGYNMVDPKFDIDPSNTSRGKRSVNVSGLSVSYYKEGIGEITSVPYGTVYSNVQDVFEFLMSYGRQLEKDGFVFDKLHPTSNEIMDWMYSGKQFLFWASEKWTDNNFITLSPAADSLTFKTETGTVKNVEDIIQGTYSIVDASGSHIRPEDVDVTRYQDQIIVTPTSSSLYGVRLYLTEIEHAVVFSNVTKFNDLLFDQTIGLRVPRLRISGTRISNWTGRIEADGYIVDPEKNVLYPNLEKQTDDFREFRDIDSVGLSEEQSQLVGKSIGYNGSTNLVNMSMSESAQLEFHKSVIREKGTRNAAKSLSRSSLINNGTGVDVDEEWAILTSQYGGTGTLDYIEFELLAKEIKERAQYINFTDTDNLNFDSKFDDVINFIDTVEDGVVTKYDDRWAIPKKTPTMFSDNKKLEDFKSYVSDTGYPKLSEVNYSALNIDTLITGDDYKNASAGDYVWIAEDRDVFSEWVNGWNVRQLESQQTTARVRDDNSIHVASTVQLEEDDILLFKSIDSDNIHKKVKYVDQDGDNVVKEISYDSEVDESIISVKGKDLTVLKSLEITIEEEFDGNYPGAPSVEIYSPTDVFKTITHTLAGGSNTFDFSDVTVLDDSDIKIKFNKAIATVPDNSISHDIVASNEYTMPELHEIDKDAIVTVKKDGKILSEREYVVEKSLLKLANVEYTVNTANMSSQSIRFHNEEEVIVFENETADSVAKKINQVEGVNAVGTANTVVITTPHITEFETKPVSVLDITSRVATTTSVVNEVFEVVNNQPQVLERMVPVDKLIQVPVDIKLVLTPGNTYTEGDTVLVVHQVDETLNGLYEVTEDGHKKITSSDTIETSTLFYIASFDHIYRMNVGNDAIYIELGARERFCVVDNDTVTVFADFTNPVCVSSLAEFDGLNFVEDIDEVVGDFLYISVDLNAYSDIQYATKGKASVKLDYTIPRIVAVGDTSDMDEEKTYDVYIWRTRRFVNNLSVDLVASNSKINPKVKQYSQLTVNGNTANFNKVSNTLFTGKNPSTKLNTSMTFDIGSSQFTIPFNALTLSGVYVDYTNIPVGSTLSIQETGIDVYHEARFSLVERSSDLGALFGALEGTRFKAECPAGVTAIDTTLPASIANINELVQFLQNEITATGNSSLQLTSIGNVLQFRASSTQAAMVFSNDAIYTMGLRERVDTIDNVSFTEALKSTRNIISDVTSNKFSNIGTDATGNTTFTFTASPNATGISFSSSYGASLFDFVDLDPDAVYDTCSITDIQKAIELAPVTKTGELVSQRNNRLYINYTSEVVDPLFRDKLAIMSYSDDASANTIGIKVGDYSYVDVDTVKQEIEFSITTNDADIFPVVTRTDDALEAKALVLYNVRGFALNISGDAMEQLGLRNMRTRRPLAGYQEGDLIFVDDSATYNINKEIVAGSALKGISTVHEYKNGTFGIKRVDGNVTDINVIKKAQVYDSAENTVITDLTLFDPMKGAIPGTADAEIYYKSTVDPARYSTAPWGSKQVGRVWFDLTTAKYIKYEQHDDLEYTRGNWGRLFPGAKIRLAEWIMAPVKPEDWDDYVEDNDLLLSAVGTPLNTEKYVEESFYNLETKKSENKYYFWVVDKQVAPENINRNMSIVEAQNVIEAPDAYGVNWIAPVAANGLIVATVNTANDHSVVQLELSNNKEQKDVHTEWDLMREAGQDEVPARHWNKMRDSLVGFDEKGLNVPDTSLPKKLQLGHNIRPRQSWFNERDMARRDLFNNLNNIIRVKDVVDLDDFLTALNNLEYIDKPVYKETIVKSSNSATITTVSDTQTGEVIEINGTNVHFTPNVVKSTGKADVGDIFNTNPYTGRMFVSGLGIDITQGSPISNVVRVINEQSAETNVTTEMYINNDNVFIDFKTIKSEYSIDRGLIGNVGSALGLSYGTFRDTIKEGSVTNPSIDAGDTVIINGNEFAFTETDILNNANIIEALNNVLQGYKTAPITDLTMLTGRRFRIEYDDGTLPDLYTFGSTVDDLPALVNVNVTLVDSNKLCFHSNKTFRLVNDLINDDEWDKLEIDSKWRKMSDKPYEFYETASNAIGIKYKGLVISDYNLGNINDIVGTHVTSDMKKVAYDIKTANISDITARLEDDTQYLEIVNTKGGVVSVIGREGTMFDILDFDVTYEHGDYPVKTIIDVASLDLVLQTTENGQTVYVTHDLNVNGWSLWRKENNAFSRIANQTVNTVQFWKYIDWFSDGVVRSNPSRVFATILEFSAAKPEFDSEVVKVINDGTGKWAMYEASNGEFVIVGKEARTIEFDVDALAVNEPKIEIRKILDAVRNVLLSNEEERKLFFGMIDSVFAEQDNVDWIFKTSYLHLSNIKDEVYPNPVYEHDYIDNYSTFLEDVKPYHTKIREVSRTKNFQVESTNVNVTDFDKPVTIDGEVLKYPADLSVIASDSKLKPWLDDIERIQNTGELTVSNVANGPGTYENRIRKMKIGMKLDRVSNYGAEDESGAASRIRTSYEPKIGMLSKENALRTGFKGTIVDSGPFNLGTGWDSAEWDILGWDAPDEMIKEFYDNIVVGSVLPQNLIGYSSTYTKKGDGINTVIKLPDYLDANNTKTVKLNDTDLVNTEDYVIKDRELIMLRNSVKGTVIFPSETSVVIPADNKDRGIVVDNYNVNFDGATEYTVTDLIAAINALSIPNVEAKVHKLPTQEIVVELVKSRTDYSEEIIISLQEDNSKESILELFGIVANDYNALTKDDTVTVVGTFGLVFDTPDNGEAGTYTVISNATTLAPGKDYVVEGDKVRILTTDDSRVIGTLPDGTLFITSGEAEQPAPTRELEGGKYIQPHLEGYPEELIPVKPEDILNIYMETRTAVLEGTTTVTTIPAGTFSINGVSISTDGTDTLTDIIEKINSSNSGVKSGEIKD